MKDPFRDWLPHCVICDGRHPDEETCAEFAKRLAEKNKEKAA